MKYRKSDIRWIATCLALTGGVIAFMVWWIGLEALKNVFISLGIWGIGLCGFLYAVTMMLRALRFAITFGSVQRPPMRFLLEAVVIHQFFNHILPARIGELSFPYYLKRQKQLPFERSVATLLIVRFYDAAILCGFIGISVYWLIQRNQSFSAEGLTRLALIFAFIILVLGTGLTYFSKYLRINNPAKKISLDPGIENTATNSLRQRIHQFLFQFQLELRTRISIQQHIFVFSISFLIWISLCFFFYIFLKEAGVQIAFVDTFVGASFSYISQFLPINTFGSFGSLEAGWVAGFVLVGVESNTALSTGLIMHTLVLFYLSIPTAFTLLVRRGR